MEICQEPCRGAHQLQIIIDFGSHLNDLHLSQFAIVRVSAGGIVLGLLCCINAKTSIDFRQLISLFQVLYSRPPRF